MKESITIDDLGRIRKIINLIIEILENNIINFSDGKDVFNIKNNSNNYIKNKELINFLIGNKDNVVSIISKLTNLLIKLIPLEEKINTLSFKDEKLSDDDVDILKKYIDKC